VRNRIASIMGFTLMAGFPRIFDRNSGLGQRIDQAQS